MQKNKLPLYLIFFLLYPLWENNTLGKIGRNTEPLCSVFKGVHNTSWTFPEYLIYLLCPGGNLQNHFVIKKFNGENIPQNLISYWCDRKDWTIF